MATSALVAQSWQDADFGFVSAAGSSSESAGVVTVRGSGADVWEAADEFHFRSLPLSGDGEIVARITRQENTGAWAKAGVMLRASLQSNAPNVFLFLTPHGELVRQDRFAVSGLTSSRSMAYASAPLWLRLVRRGQYVTAYFSSDGTNWQGEVTLTANLGNDLLAGLAVTSHQDGVLCAASFDNVRLVTASTAPPPAAPTNLAASSVGATSVRLTWTDNAIDETAYQLERGTDGTNFAVGALLGENATSATDGSVAAGTRYYFRVRAARGSSLSAPSNVVQVTTLAAGGDDMAWHDRDVGTVAAAGGTSESANSSTITVRGSGDDVWGTADECHFRYKLVTGDCEVFGTVAAIDNTDPAAKAGVMIRAGLEPGAPCAFLAFNPSFAATFYQRTSANAAMAINGSAWLWAHTALRLVRRGDVFTAYANGQSVGAATIVMPATVAIGFAVSSHRDGTLCSATFEICNVVLAQAPSPLPAPVALTATARSSTAVDLAWDYTGTSATSIEIHVSNDGVNFNSNWSVGGTRMTYSGLSAGLQYYFKLRAREGSSVSAFSNIASARTSAGEAPPAPPSDASVVALSSTSLRLSWRDNSTNETSFVIIRRRDGFGDASFSLAANTTSYTDTGLEPATSYSYLLYANGAGGAVGSVVVSGTTQPPASPPPPFQGADIGAPAVAGQAVPGTDSVALSGAGDDVWDARDEFFSYARDLSGDGEVLVRVDAVQNTNYWAKAGVMLRGSSDPAAANIFLYVTPDFRLGVQIRGQNGATTQLWKQMQVVSPVWLRLKRTGNQVRAELSTDQANWGLVDYYTVALPTTVRAGLAVTSHADGTLCRAQFTHLRVYGGATDTSTPPPPPSPPPAVSTWTRTAIGFQGLAGTSTDLSNGSVTVSGAGTDIWDVADGFVFYNRPLRGDGSITACVQSLTATHAWAKAGVMLRSTLTPDSAHVFAYITPANGAGTHVRAQAGTTTENVPGPWWPDAPYFLRLTRTGDTITTYGSDDGTTWTLLSTQTRSMPADVFLGLAVTSHDTTRLNQVQFTNVTTNPP